MPNNRIIRKIFYILADNSMSSPMQNRRNMTFNRRKMTYSSSPRQDETFSKMSPIKATNATYDKEQYIGYESSKDTSRSERSSVASSNDQEALINVQVPNLHDNPNSTFDVPMQDKSAVNATFTCDENNSDNQIYNEGVHIRKTTYAIPPGNSTFSRTSVNSSKEENNANHDNLTYNDCDTSSTSECPNDMQTNMQLPTHQKMSRDSSQGKIFESSISFNWSILLLICFFIGFYKLSITCRPFRRRSNIRGNIWRKFLRRRSLSNERCCWSK